MKNLSLLLVVVGAMVLAGCSGDKSSDVQAPQAVKPNPAGNAAIDANSSMPDSAKKTLGSSLPPQPKGN